MGGSIDESEFDRQKAIYWEMLSLNKHRINERVGRLESTRDFKTISGRMSDVRKRVSE